MASLVVLLGASGRSEEELFRRCDCELNSIWIVSLPSGDREAENSQGIAKEGPVDVVLVIAVESEVGKVRRCGYALKPL